MKQGGKKVPYAKAAVAVVGAVAVIFALRALNPNSEKGSGEAATLASTAQGGDTPQGSGATKAGEPRKALMGDKVIYLDDRQPEVMPPAPTPEPADQEIPVPSSYLKTNFRDRAAMEQFKLEGMEITPEGIKLAGEPDANGVRTGVLESPPLPLELSSNCVVPIWRGTNPDGSATQVEVQVIQAGKQSPWYVVELDDEPIYATYPDGSPNPNYGANVGTAVGLGLELYDQVRYRMTVSASGESPVLTGMDVFHLNSTAGEGFPASDPPPERGVLEAAAQAGH